MNARIKPRIISENSRKKPSPYGGTSILESSLFAKAPSVRLHQLSKEPHHQNRAHNSQSMHKRQSGSHKNQQQREDEVVSGLQKRQSGLRRRVSEQRMDVLAPPDNPLELTKHASAVVNKEKVLQLISEGGIEDLGERMKLRVNRSKRRRNYIFITKGNNHGLIRQIFIQKYGFQETALKQHAGICWLQWLQQKQIPFRSPGSILEHIPTHLPQIGKKTQPYQIFNYLECHSELTNKQRLFKNMKKHYPQSIGNYIPKTFVVDFKLDQSLLEENLLDFLGYYFTRDRNKKIKSKVLTVKNYFMEVVIHQKQLIKQLEKMRFQDGLSSTEERQGEQDEVENDAMLWILKPTSLNRGRGIHLFSSLKQLSKLLSETSFEISVKMYQQSIRPNAYIIQEYIDRPLLIDGYKFDIRMWVMIQVVKINGKKQLKAYLFRYGYARLASIKYEPEGDKVQQNPEGQEKSPKRERKNYIGNRYIHLTNNAVQKEAKDYGKFCEGNQLSMEDTVDYFKQRSENRLNLQKLLGEMEGIVLQSISSVKERLILNNIPKTFQLFGYDFLLDHNFKLWLIEVNCNPCIEESSQLLGRLLRQMLSGLVVLTGLSEQGNREGWVDII